MAVLFNFFLSLTYIKLREVTDRLRAISKNNTLPVKIIHNLKSDVKRLLSSVYSQYFSKLVT